MSSKRKAWKGLGVAALAGTMLSTPALANSLDDSGVPTRHALALFPLQIATGEGGEAGEGGEGGEAGHHAEAEGSAGYLTNLALMRGHLHVGVQLYREGYADAAKTHMKHPGDELYNDMLESFEEKGFEGFAGELYRLAKAVEGERTLEEVEAAYEAVLVKISEAESLRREGTVSEQLAVIHALAATAAEEYDVAVEDGNLVELHEYQDALGFIAVARLLLTAVVADAPAGDAEALGLVEEQLDVADRLFSGVMPSEEGLSDPSPLYGAAARIEIAALSVSD